MDDDSFSILLQRIAPTIQRQDIVLRNCATKSHSSRRKTVFNTEIPSHRHSTHKHGYVTYYV